MQGTPYMLLRVGGNRAGSTVRWAKVDVADYAALSEFRWTVSIKGKARRAYAVRRADGHLHYMHRVILGLGRGDTGIVDHINGDSLDNRRRNLRVVTVAENAQNRRGSHVRNGQQTSRYRGVFYDKKRAMPWVAALCFPTEDEANEWVVAWRQKYMPFSEADKLA